MGLFHKKAKPLFGGNVEPDCAYCANNRGEAAQVLCALRLEGKGSTCKKYEYDPLMRTPRTPPPLAVHNYGEEEFKL